MNSIHARCYLEITPRSIYRMTLDHKQGRLILALAIVIAIVAVSTGSIFVRFAQREAPSLVIAALRLGFAVLAIAPLAIVRYRSELRLLTRHDLWLGVLSGAFLAVHFAAWITSLEYTSIISSVVLVSTGPLWVALFAPLFLNEQLSRAVLIGMLLALLGGTVIAMGDSCEISGGLVCPSMSGILHGDALLGNFLALVGAWAVAGYLLIGRRLRRGMSLVPYIFLVYGVAAVALCVAMLIAGQRPVGFSGMTYIWILLLALVPQLIGHSTFNWILRYVPATLVAITTLGEPVGSTVLAYFVLQEIPAVLTLFGGFLILAGIYLSSRKQSR
jgi:drug/metabolite transporter (DMT)-like permease